MASSPASGPEVSSPPALLARFPSRYLVELYIAQERARRDVRRFVSLSFYSDYLSIPKNRASHTAAGIWRKK